MSWEEVAGIDFRVPWRTRVRLAWVALFGGIERRDDVGERADAWRYPGNVGQAREFLYEELSRDDPDEGACRRVLRGLEEVLGSDDAGVSQLRWSVEAEFSTVDDDDED